MKKTELTKAIKNINRDLEKLTDKINVSELYYKSIYSFYLLQTQTTLKQLLNIKTKVK